MTQRLKIGELARSLCHSGAIRV